MIRCFCSNVVFAQTSPAIAARNRSAVSATSICGNSNSSGWVHEKWPERLFQWQNGYGAFSVSESSKDTVVRYIENQAEHHRVRSFQEEFLELLNQQELVLVQT